MPQEEPLKIPLAELLSRYPPQDNGAEADIILGAELQNNKLKIIVLDDDPTGVQTVHGISVYTGWTA